MLQSPKTLSDDVPWREDTYPHNEMGARAGAEAQQVEGPARSIRGRRSAADREPLSRERHARKKGPGSIRMLFFVAGLASDVISTNDVAVAFLQAIGFAHDDARYVSYKAYREATEHLFRLHGPLYGQRCASKKFYLTMSGWLSDQGFAQAKNEPCLFVNAVTGMRVILVVDDLLVRGPADQTDLFHDALESRFECSPGSRKFRGSNPEMPVFRLDKDPH